MYILYAYMDPLGPNTGSSKNASIVWRDALFMGHHFICVTPVSPRTYVQFRVYGNMRRHDLTTTTNCRSVDSQAGFRIVGALVVS